MAEEEAWPEVGELVVATVAKIFRHGAYVTLDEYGKREGFLHISEVSTTWVRNFRDFVREGRKVVLKVLRVNRERGHIDLSLKRVSDRERKEELLYWKRRSKGKALLNQLAERLNTSYEDIYENVGKRLEEKFGGLYEAFEEAHERKDGPLLELGLPQQVVDGVCSIAMEKVKVPTVTVRGTFELSSLRRDGVEVVKKTLSSIESLDRGKDLDVNLYTIASPRYRVEVTARNYRDAERFLKEAIATAESMMKQLGGTFTFKREG